VLKDILCFSLDLTPDQPILIRIRPQLLDSGMNLQVNYVNNYLTNIFGSSMHRIVLSNDALYASICLFLEQIFCVLLIVSTGRAFLSLNIVFNSQAFLL
jgi:hypothetical protein